jgi:capsular polysaccharide biosynthesis protein
VKRTLPRRSLALGAAVAGIAAAAVVGYVFAWSDTYEAEAAIEVTPVAADDATFAGFSVLRAGRDPVETAAQLVETRPVADAVAVRLRLGDGGEALDAVNADAESRGSVVRVRAQGSTGIEAARLANAFADELIRQRSSLFQSELQRTIDSLRTQLANVPATRRDEPSASALARRLAELRTYEGRGDPTLRTAATATAPRDPDRPSPLPVLAIGLPFALLLGAATALMLASRRRQSVVLPPPDERSRLRVEEHERQLAERVAAVTARELELARRAAQLARRERELEGLQAEPEPEPEHEPEPEPEPEPEQPEPAEPPSAAAPTPGGRNLVTLEHAVAQRERELSPARREELHAYLAYLRSYAEPDGTLANSFDPLVDEIFGELVRP